MYPAAAPIRSPRGSAHCHACGLLACRPARVLRFADPSLRHGRFVRLCEACFTQIFLLERPAVCAAIRGQTTSRQAWYRHVGPILFDQVREGLPEPSDLHELALWLQAERARQVGVSRWLAAQLGADFPYEVPAAVSQVLAACAERLAA